MKTKLLNCKGKCPNCHRQTVVKDTAMGDKICVGCGWWEGDTPEMDKLNKIQRKMGEAMANKIWGSKEASKFVHKIYGRNEVLQ
jgi:transcription initiation factor TFIIIB Brf1 subunit/transcription initiation factor TFIIB